MTEFSQNGSPLRFFCGKTKVALLPVRLNGWERLNDSFEFALDLMVPRDHTRLPGMGDMGGEARGHFDLFHHLLGKPAGVTVELDQELSRHFNGIIWSVKQFDSDAIFDHYRVVLKPQLARLGLVKRSRIFQNQTTPEILKEVLEPVGGAVFELNGGNTPRIYCTQYNETDLEFFLRLCNEEGISHYWQHATKGHETVERGNTQGDDNDKPPETMHTLVLTNNTTLCQSIGQIQYNPSLGGSDLKPGIHSWQVEQKLTPTLGQLFDSNFQSYGRVFQAQASGPESIEAGGRSYKTQAAPGPWVCSGLPVVRQFDAITSTGTADPGAISLIGDAQEHQARLAAKGMAADSVRVIARGDCGQVTVGHSFELRGHDHQDGHWLAVRVDHKIEVVGSYWSGQSASVGREALIEAAPLSLAQVPWPPCVKNKVNGVETAMVTGPKSLDTFVDPYGRVKVNFWFDPRQEKNSTSSCWVRVAQGWAGKGYGAAFWPRIGHEVVVSFEGGDPDRPIITGSVYNGTNQPPFDLPENVYLSGFKTLCQGGDVSENYHLLLLSDERGAEVVHIHAEARFNTTQESSQVNMKPLLDVSVQGKIL